MRDQEHERRSAEDMAIRNTRLQRLQDSRERQLVYSEVALLDQPDVRAPRQLIIGRVHRSTNFRAAIEARQL